MPSEQPLLTNAQEVGEALREAMRAKDLSGKAMATRLGWAQSRVSRMLSGERGMHAADVAAFLTECGVQGPQRDRLLLMCSAEDRHVVPQGLPLDLRAYLRLENNASRIFQYAANLIPDLLATVDYLHAVLVASATVPADGHHWRLAGTLGRAGLLALSKRLEFEFLVHEWALRTPVGGPVIAADQLRHVHRLTSRRNVSVRVVPSSIGAHPGIAGSFTMFEFEDRKPLVYRPGEESGQFLGKDQEIDRYRQVLAGLRKVSLTEPDSREFISAVATTFDDSEKLR